MASHKAYFIGRIQRQDDGAYVLTSVFIASAPPGQLTSHGERFVELLPAVDGASFGDARDKAIEYWDDPKYGAGKMMFRGLKTEWKS